MQWIIPHRTGKPLLVWQIVWRDKEDIMIEYKHRVRFIGQKEVLAQMKELLCTEFFTFNISLLVPEPFALWRTQNIDTEKSYFEFADYLQGELTYEEYVAKYPQANLAAGRVSNILKETFGVKTLPEWRLKYWGTLVQPNFIEWSEDNQDLTFRSYGSYMKPIMNLIADLFPDVVIDWIWTSNETMPDVGHILYAIGGIVDFSHVECITEKERLHAYCTNREVFNHVTA